MTGPVMAKRYWFKPKSHGYGATPTTWEGWALTLAGVAVIFGASWYFVNSGRGEDWPAVLAYLATIAAVVAVLVAVSYCKTDGAWRWRWGSRSEPN
jgi:hypothetical protein